MNSLEGFAAAGLAADNGYAGLPEHTFDELGRSRRRFLTEPLLRWQRLAGLRANFLGLFDEVSKVLGLFFQPAADVPFVRASRPDHPKVQHP
jgi:hypothetical protein